MLAFLHLLRLLTLIVMLRKTVKLCMYMNTPLMWWIKCNINGPIRRENDSSYFIFLYIMWCFQFSNKIDGSYHNKLKLKG